MRSHLAACGRFNDDTEFQARPDRSYRLRSVTDAETIRSARNNLSTIMLRQTQQTCPPWTLRAWPPLLWQADRKVNLHLRHLGTRVTNPGDQVSRTAGQTLWASVSEDGEAGMAWDWVHLSRGVVAMADPLSVITNLRLIGPEGTVLNTYQSALHLNELVQALPWQDEVERALLCGGVSGRA
jgi:hypothetical protein